MIHDRILTEVECATWSSMNKRALLIVSNSASPTCKTCFQVSHSLRKSHPTKMEDDYIIHSLRSAKKTNWSFVQMFFSKMKFANWLVGCDLLLRQRILWATAANQRQHPWMSSLKARTGSGTCRSSLCNMAIYKICRFFLHWSTNKATTWRTWSLSDPNWSCNCDCTSMCSCFLL